MMCRIVCAVLVVCAAAAAAAAAPEQKGARPNIIVILADDLGYSDLSSYGSEIPTPNIDRLATHGVRFIDFYNSARCCPSRAAMMTGLYQHQAGVGAMIDSYAKWIREAADRPSYQDRLSPDTPTMPELLRTAGYRTIMCGKWHLGYRPEEWPVSRGFDRSFVLIPGAMNYFGGESTGPRAPMALDDQPFEPPHDGFFATDAFTDRAIEFVQEAKQTEQPFFLYMAVACSTGRTCFPTSPATTKGRSTSRSSGASAPAARSAAGTGSCNGTAMKRRACTTWPTTSAKAMISPRPTRPSPSD